MTAGKSLRRLLLLSAFLAPSSVAFTIQQSQPRILAVNLSSLTLHAKKKKGKRSGQGFGKAPPEAESAAKQSESTSTVADDDDATTPVPSFLQSVETGGSSSIPTMDTASSNEPELPPEERAKQLLRDQYGLRTLEEQRMADSIDNQRKRLDELKQMANKGEDIDLFAMVPAPVLKGIDTFLKLGVAVCTVLFVTAGLGITAEAWSKASDNPLPENIDSFIVDVVEPNFTYGLLVLLGFSISLGAFAALQLGSASSQYKEE